MTNNLGVSFNIIGVNQTQAMLSNALNMTEFKEYFSERTEQFFADVVESTPIYKERMQPNWTYEMDSNGLSCTISNIGLAWAGLVVFGSEQFVTSIERGTDMSGRPYAHPKTDGELGILEDVSGMLDTWTAAFMDGIQ